MAVENLWLIKTPTGGNSRFVAVTDTDVPVAGAIPLKKKKRRGTLTINNCGEGSSQGPFTIVLPRCQEEGRERERERVCVCV